MKKKDSFNELKFGGKIVVMTLFGLLTTVVVLFVVGAYFFGFAGFFHVFNVEYESNGALLLFLIFYLILNFFTSLFAQASLIISSAYVKDKNKIVTMKILLEFLFAWLAIYVVDEMMVRIQVPVGTEITLALILVVADHLMAGKRKSPKKA
ncbi:YrvL family regulatory protein [Oceanobacillus salinisoli]|uniref:YrvL family regulatory protein n=1 Tax=Oceanobacillus salinisoli TaxID=2678611 RepID=UPI0012E266F1|nr:YrvL family regulatory protein [Oceanobacillus salinisoli]